MVDRSLTSREQLTGTPTFLSELESSFYATVEGRPVVPGDVQNMFASFGELASFTPAGSDPLDQVSAFIPLFDLDFEHTFYGADFLRGLL